MDGNFSKFKIDHYSILHISFCFCPNKIMDQFIKKFKDVKVMKAVYYYNFLYFLKVLPYNLAKCKTSHSY